MLNRSVFVIVVCGLVNGRIPTSLTLSRASTADSGSYWWRGGQDGRKKDGDAGGHAGPRVMSASSGRLLA